MAIIFSFLLLIISKKMSVINALVLIPVLFGFFAGFDPIELGRFAFDGIKQVAPTGILLMFAVLYFSVMLDAGLFDPVISFIIKKVKGDPLKVVIGTAILTMIVHLDGDGTATFMIVLSAFLPIYKKLNLSRLVLATVVALSVGPLHLVPWSGTSVPVSYTHLDVYKRQDLNKDDKPDIITGFVESPSVVFYNEGNNKSFKQIAFGDSNGTVYGFAIGDFNKDGIPDIAAARSEATNILYFGALKTK